MRHVLPVSGSVTINIKTPYHILLLLASTIMQLGLARSAVVWYGVYCSGLGMIATAEKFLSDRDRRRKGTCPEF